MILGFLLLATAGAVAGTALRPGWSRAALPWLWRALLWCAGPALAVAAGAALDERVRVQAGRVAQQQVGPALAPAGAWLMGPALPPALGAAVLLALALALDFHQPGWLSRHWLGGRAARAARVARAALRPAAALLPLLWGWSDVLATTAGDHTSAVYALAARWRLPLPGPLPGGAHPDLPAFVWWLAAAGLALLAACEWPDPRRRMWAAVPLVGGMAGALSRPLAATGAVPAFVLVAAAALAVAWRSGRGDVMARRVALLAILALALQVRWWGFDQPLGPDASGYRNVALDFHQRVAQTGTNPLALMYLDMHPQAREPLFPMLNRLTYDLLGDAKIHGQYLTIFASVATVALTYAFARLTLGALAVPAGLGAALLLALEPWHISFSHQGLREEVALLLVYGLAALCALPRARGAGTAVLAGTLAAAATLTRIDAALTVGALLLYWCVARAGWRRGALAALTYGLLLAPLLAGYQLHHGEALAPLGSDMGGDMHEAVDPLLRLQYPLGIIVDLFVRGTLFVYGSTVFGALGEWLSPLLGALAVPLVLCCFGAGLLHAAWRGPRLVALLAVLGAYLPPFTYIAGVKPVNGPYTERYTYLILPAALALLSWVVVRVVRGAALSVWPILYGRFCALTASPSPPGRPSWRRRDVLTNR